MVAKRALTKDSHGSESAAAATGWPSLAVCVTSLVAYVYYSESVAAFAKEVVRLGRLL